MSMADINARVSLLKRGWRRGNSGGAARPAKEGTGKNDCGTRNAQKVGEGGWGKEGCLELYIQESRPRTPCPRREKGKLYPTRSSASIDLGVIRNRKRLGERRKD